MKKRMFWTVLVALVVALPSAGTLESADAQTGPVRFGGRVQWIAGQVMVVQVDNGPSVSVDLLRVPQDQYAVLTPSERVIVVGVVTDTSRRVIATTIVRTGEAQAL